MDYLVVMLKNIIVFKHKFRHPIQRVTLTNRTYLLEKLNDNITSPLITIVSPAGFGKSTLMSLFFNQVQNSEQNKAVWISLDSADNEANQFLSLICQALVTIGVADDTLITRANNSSANADQRELAEAILRLIENSPQQIYIFFDDFHFISNKTISSFLDRLLLCNLDNLHLVISSRIQPNIDTNYLYSQGLHFYLDAEKLRFSLAETNDLLEELLSKEQIELLYEQTDGWPVAIQLSRLWYIQNPNSTPTKTLSNNLDTLSNYLREQVFQKFDEETQNFLLKTSFLDSFSIELANFVCEISNGSEIISTLTPYESLIFSLDSEGLSIRYHQLFSDFLQQTFTSMHGQIEVRKLRHRAAQWFAQEKYLSDSICQYVRANDKSSAIDLIKQGGGWELILTKGIGFVESVLSHFNEADFINFESLGLLRCYLFLKMGKVLAAKEQLLITQQMNKEQCQKMQSSQKINRDLLIVGLLVEVYLDNIPENGIFKKLADALLTLDNYDHLGRGIILAIEALVLNQTSNFANAEKKSIICIREMRLANCWVGVNYITLHYGQSLAYRGLLNQAHELFTSANELAEKHLGLDNGLQSMATCLTAEVEYQLGNVELAHTMLKKGISALFQRDCWYDIYAVVFKLAVNLSILHKDLPANLSYIEQGKSIASDRKLDRLQVLLDVLALKVAYSFSQDHKFEKIHKRILTNEMWAASNLIWGAKEEYHYLMALYFLRKNNSRKVQLHTCELLSLCENSDQKIYIIKAKLISALSFYSLGEYEPAFKLATEAIQVASKLHSKQLFYDLPDGIESLLSKLKSQYAAPLDPKSAALVGELLNEIKTTTETGLSQLGLSHREQQLIPLLMKSKSNKEISSELGISENTVKFHLKNLFVKINVKSRNEATIFFLTSNFKG